MESNRNCEELPVNEEVFVLKGIFPQLSIEGCEELYATYGGTASHAANRIIDDMEKGGYNGDVVKYVNALVVNKENELRVPTNKTQQKSPEWQVVASPRRSNSLAEVPLYLNNNNEPDSEKVVLRHSAPGMTIEETRTLFSSILEDQEAKMLVTEIYNENHPKLMIIMRGVPGSGKSSLAKILFAVSRGAAICSADSYFEDGKGNYKFNRTLLSFAHSNCKDKCKTMLEKHVSPVIIDNTNTTLNEMSYYVNMAIKNNYTIKLVEPFTAWKNNLKTLTRKNVHGVPKESILSMLNRFESTFEYSLIENAIRDMKMHGCTVEYNPEVKAKSTSYPSPSSSFNDGLKGAMIHSVKYGRDGMFLSSPSPPLLSDHLPDLTEPLLSPGPMPRNKKGTTIDILNADICDVEGARSRMAAVFPECAGGTGASGCEFKSDNLIHDTVSFNAGKRRFSSGSRRRNSLTALVPLNTAEPDPVEEKVSVNVSLTDADKIVNLFPNCRKTELLHLFQLCNGDINDTISQLLDSGYEMTGEMDKTREFVEESQFENAELKPDFYNYSQVRDFTSSSSEFMDQEEIYKMQGARPKTLVGQGRSSSDEEERQPYRIDEEDLYVPVDGDDWIDIRLPNEFIEILSNLYGEPYCKSTSKLSEVEKNIRIDPSMAFDLYRLLTLNVRRFYYQTHDNQVDEEDVIIPLEDEQEQEQNKAEDFDEADDAEMEDLLNNIHKMNIETASVTPNLSNIVELEQKISTVELGKLERMKNLKRSMAQNIKFAQLKLAFPSLGPTLVDDFFVQNNLNFDATMTALREVYPFKFVDSKVKKEEEPIVCKSQFPEGGELTYDPEVVSRMSATERREMGEAAQNWKFQYEEYVESVRLYMEKANQHRGQSEVFSYFMVKAAEAKALLKQSQKEYWFYTVIGLNAGNNDPNKIDLHGLSVNNALEIVGKFLKNRTAWYRNSNISEAVHLNIITGIGKHSPNNIPKINPAVRNYLQSGHYSYSDMGGFFMVHLTRKKVVKKGRH